MKKLFVLMLSLIILVSSVVMTSAENNVVKIDHHMHMASEEYSKVFKKALGNDMYLDIPIEEVCGNDIIALLDEAGMEKAFVLSGGYILGMPGLEGSDEYGDVKKENNYIAIETAKNPDRLTGFFSFNPLKDYVLDELDRCVDILGLSGLKLHFTNSDVDLTNPDHLERIKTLFTRASEKDVSILLHYKSRSPEYGARDAEILIDEIISQIPDLKLQIAHLGGWGGFDNSTREVLLTFIEKYNSDPSLNKDNIYFDLSAVIVTDREASLGLQNTSEFHEEIANMLRDWGLDHIAWGSDYQYQTPKKYLEYLDLLPLTEDEKVQILDNDLSQKFFKNYDGPDLDHLNKILVDGVDYNAPLSANE